jgi:hypothetical protein
MSESRSSLHPTGAVGEFASFVRPASLPVAYSLGLVTLCVGQTVAAVGLCSNWEQ